MFKSAQKSIDHNREQKLEREKSTKKEICSKFFVSGQRILSFFLCEIIKFFFFFLFLYLFKGRKKNCLKWKKYEEMKKKN